MQAIHFAATLGWPAAWVMNAGTLPSSGKNGLANRAVPVEPGKVCWHWVELFGNSNIAVPGLTFALFGIRQFSAHRFLGSP